MTQWKQLWLTLLSDRRGIAFGEYVFIMAFAMALGVAATSYIGNPRYVSVHYPQSLQFLSRFN